MGDIKMLGLKRKSKSQQVFEALQKAGKHGVDNRQLNKIMFRYGSVLHRLRQEGHNVQTVLIKKGYYKYYLED
jgi:hypothetical protein